MADRADDSDCCFPSVERIHKDTGADRKTIILSLDRLQASNLIIDTGMRKGATGKVKVYQLLGVSHRDEEDETVPKTELLNSTKNGMIKTDETIPKTEPLTDLTVPKTEPLTGVIVPNFPSNSPKNGTQNLTNNLKEKDYKNLDFSSWPQMPEKQTLIDWFAMRKRLKADVSQTVVNRLAKQLQLAVDAGYTVDDCIALCVERNWRGFELEWMKNTQTQKRGFKNETDTGNSPRRETALERNRRQTQEYLKQFDEGESSGHGVVVGSVV